MIAQHVREPAEGSAATERRRHSVAEMAIAHVARELSHPGALDA
jgi:hypothetical protein